jgi:glycosyltransferase involved in cell wall biosynthesis
MHPEISVLVSTYNSRRFLEKKLKEVQQQTHFKQAEFLFIETASPERERDVLAPFCRQNSNCRLVATDDRRTLYEAWNLGWDQARSPFLCYSNMDDTMHPRLLETIVAGMKRKGWDIATVLIAKQSLDDPQLDNWTVGRLRRLPLSLRPGPFTVWRSELRDRIGQFDGTLQIAGDLDFWSRAVAHRLSIGLVKKVLYLYTKSPGQLSKADPHQRLRAEREIINARPHRAHWSKRLRWQIFWRRYVFRLFPQLYWVQPRES